MREWLTVKEFAAYAEVHVHTVYRWIEGGQIEAYRVVDRGRFRIPRHQLRDIGRSDLLREDGGKEAADA